MQTQRSGSDEEGRPTNFTWPEDGDLYRLLVAAGGMANTPASRTLVMRTRMEIRREIQRRTIRRSLMRRALGPALACVSILYLLLIESALDPSFNDNVFKITGLYFYLLAIAIPCLVVGKERRGRRYRP
jgi:hypothetical protein